MSLLPPEIAARWAPVLDDLSARAKLLRRTVVLDGQRAASQRLAEQLLADIRTGAVLCSHFDPRRPTAATWSPGAGRLQCFACWQVALHADPDRAGDRCDHCRQQRPGETVGGVLLVGPVFVWLVICRRCHTRRMRGTYDLARAGRQVIAILDRRLLEAAR